MREERYKGGGRLRAGWAGFGLSCLADSCSSDRAPEDGQTDGGRLGREATHNVDDGTGSLNRKEPAFTPTGRCHAGSLFTNAFF